MAGVTLHTLAAAHLRRGACPAPHSSLCRRLCCRHVVASLPTTCLGPQVNARLAEVESEHGGSSSSDPLVPKVQWPAAAACGACRAGAGGGAGNGTEEAGAGAGAAVQWDEGAVFAYLEQAYASLAPDTGASLGLAGSGGGGGGSWDMVVWLVVGCALFGAGVVYMGRRGEHRTVKTL